MNNILKEFLIIAILVIAFLYILQKNKNENLDTSSPLSNEAIQNIASVYNKNNFIASNITSTGNINTDSITSVNEMNITNGGINTKGPIHTKSNVRAANVHADGNIHTDNTLSAYNLSTVTLKATGAINTDSRIHAKSLISTDDSINAGNAINTFDNGILCLGNVCLNKDMLAAIKVKAGYRALQL